MSNIVADMQAKVAELVVQAKEPLVRRVAEMEAALAKMEADWGVENQQFKAVDLLRQEAEAALAERDRMLRLAWERTFWLKPHAQPTFDDWLADLRARIAELEAEINQWQFIGKE